MNFVCRIEREREIEFVRTYFLCLLPGSIYFKLITVDQSPQYVFSIAFLYKNYVRPKGTEKERDRTYCLCYVFTYIHFSS